MSEAGRVEFLHPAVVENAGTLSGLRVVCRNIPLDPVISMTGVSPEEIIRGV